MEDLLLRPDSRGRTPLIDFKTSGELTIAGRSIVEDAIEYYKPVLEWIKDLNEGGPSIVTMSIHLEYFNTSSSKVILNILRSLERIHLRGKTRVIIKWLYSDDDLDMYEAGHDYQSFVKLPIRMTSTDKN